jgi:hypothetical protein
MRRKDKRRIKPLLQGGTTWLLEDVPRSSRSYT